MGAVYRLVYFEGCPNVGRARRLLEEAGLPFGEVRQDLLSDQDPLKGYGSPTVLRNSDVIFGARTGEGSGACSLDLPTLEEFKRRLGVVQSGQTGAPAGRPRSGVLAAIGSIGSAITVGLCPVCIPALGALLSSLGLGFLAKEAVLQPLLIALLVITAFGLFWSYLKEHGRIGPLLAGVALSVGLYVSRYVYLGAVVNSVLMYGSIVGMIAVSFWNLMLRKSAACPACIE